MSEFAKRKQTGIRTIYRDMEVLPVAGLSLYAETAEKTTGWALIDTFKFKVPSPFTFYSVIPQNATFTEPRTAAWVTTT